MGINASEIDLGSISLILLDVALGKNLFVFVRKIQEDACL